MWNEEKTVGRNDWIPEECEKYTYKIYILVPDEMVLLSQEHIYHFQFQDIYNGTSGYKGTFCPKDMY